jgi:hypothetical protein
VYAERLERGRRCLRILRLDQPRNKHGPLLFRARAGAEEQRGSERLERVSRGWIFYPVFSGLLTSTEQPWIKVLAVRKPDDHREISGNGGLNAFLDRCGSAGLVSGSCRGPAALHLACSRRDPDCRQPEGGACQIVSAGRLSRHPYPASGGPRFGTVRTARGSGWRQGDGSGRVARGCVRSRRGAGTNSCCFKSLWTAGRPSPAQLWS